MIIGECGDEMAEFLIMLTAWIMHELSHITAMRFLDYPVRRFYLLPWGGCLVTDDELLADNAAETIIAAAGPLFNWSMVLLVRYLALLGCNNAFWNSWSETNRLLGLINLFPAPPFDGFRIVHSFLTSLWGRRQGTVASKILALGSTFALLGVGLSRFWRFRHFSFYLWVSLFSLYHVFTYDFQKNGLLWRIWRRKRRLLEQRRFLPVKDILVLSREDILQALFDNSAGEYLRFTLYDSGEILEEREIWETASVNLLQLSNMTQRRFKKDKI